MLAAAEQGAGACKPVPLWSVLLLLLSALLLLLFVFVLSRLLLIVASPTSESAALLERCFLGDRRGEARSVEIPAPPPTPSSALFELVAK